MNSNRGNNRRRGRNNRSQSGGQHLNRIDSRARGNAPQLLDKYKKLAEEASRNGDRVQAEYYLQFADHYFRVIADGKARQDEQRQKQDNKNQSSDDDSQSDDDNGAENDNRSQRRDSGRDNTRDQGRDSTDDNPFVRDNRKRRQSRKRDDEKAESETEESVENSGALDPQALPPAIGDTSEEKPEKPKRTRRPRKPKAEAEAAQDDSEQKVVNG